MALPSEPGEVVEEQAKSLIAEANALREVCLDPKQVSIVVAEANALVEIVAALQARLAESHRNHMEDAHFYNRKVSEWQSSAEAYEARAEAADSLLEEAKVAFRNAKRDVEIINAAGFDSTRREKALLAVHNIDAFLAKLEAR